MNGKSLGLGLGHSMLMPILFSNAMRILSNGVKNSGNKAVLEVDLSYLICVDSIFLPIGKNLHYSVLIFPLYE